MYEDDDAWNVAFRETVDNFFRTYGTVSATSNSSDEKTIKEGERDWILALTKFLLNGGKERWQFMQ